MLEIGYMKKTGEITRAAYSPELVGGHLEPVSGEGIAVLDMFQPDNLGMWLYDKATQTLVPNTDYIEPEPVMDYKAEILKLQDEVRKLREKNEAL